MWQEGTIQNNLPGGDLSLKFFTEFLQRRRFGVAVVTGRRGEASRAGDEAQR